MTNIITTPLKNQSHGAFNNSIRREIPSCKDSFAQFQVLGIILDSLRKVVYRHVGKSCCFTGTGGRCL